MKKLIAPAVTAALLLSGAAFAQPMGRDANRDGNLTRAEVAAAIDARVAKLDANRDGQISPPERQAQRQQRMSDRFDRLDTDKNGQISKAEWQAAREKRGEMRGKRGHFAGKRGGMHGQGMKGAMANQTVSVADMKAKALQWFDRIDTDKNGVVTQAERQAAKAAHRGARQQ